MCADLIEKHVTDIFRITQNAYVSNKGVTFLAEEVTPISVNLSAGGRKVAVRFDNAKSSGLLQHLQKGNVFSITFKARFKSDSPSAIVNEILIGETLFPYRPLGKQVISYLSENQRFKGIGKRKADKLWAELGNDLYSALDTKDEPLLRKFLPEKTAENLCRNWYSTLTLKNIEYCQYDALLDVDTTYQAINVYGEMTTQKVRTDPFRLLAFGLDYNACKILADKNKLPADSDSRIAGAIEHVLESESKKSNTSLPLFNVVRKVADLHEGSKIDESVIEQIVQRVPARFQTVAGNSIQSNGTFYLESVIAHQVALLASKGGDEDALRPTSFNQLFSLCGKSYTIEQVEAINTCLRKSICVVSGPAGSGKTELIRGVTSALKQQGILPTLLAPTGKAARHLFNVTGESTQTIAKFLYSNADKQSKDLFLIIDESSMLDYLTFFKLLSLKKKIKKIVLVGDRNQLPPVSPGAVFHQLLDCEYIPKVLLKENKRNSFNSMIPIAAQEILKGNVINSFGDEVRVEEFVTDKALTKRLMHLSQNRDSETQVLCATNAQATSINNAFNKANTEAEICYRSIETLRKTSSGLHVNDRVLCISNITEQDLFNGTTGNISKRYQRVRKVQLINGVMVDSYGQLVCDDGTVCELTAKVLDSLRLGNAITVHKSQGSQYQRVIIVLSKKAFFTRQMLYTAVTRAVDEVIILAINGALSNAIVNNQNISCGDLLEKLDHQFTQLTLSEHAA
tara:strand:+ start:1962 stop:4178 length:2217 start_codon:yes stop_codon:yes gene_type:complete